jgi:5'-3' exonuclease
MYLDYLTKRYAHPVVVFDGYSSGPSIKDHTHSRRTKGIEGTKIEFRSKKDNFLCNNENKRAFINMLSEFLVG